MRAYFFVPMILALPLAACGGSDASTTSSAAAGGASTGTGGSGGASGSSAGAGGGSGIGGSAGVSGGAGGSAGVSGGAGGAGGAGASGAGAGGASAGAAGNAAGAAGTSGGVSGSGGAGAAGKGGAAGSGGGGTGACGGVTCTGANIACDPADGKCKLDGTTTNVGATCPKTGPNAACGADPKATCNDLTSDGFPGGYCSVEPCTTASLCPIGASCGGLGGESPACWKNCSTDADCRAPDYKCWDMGALYTSGASKKVCFLTDWPCAKASECPASAPNCGPKKTCVP